MRHDYSTYYIFCKDGRPDDMCHVELSGIIRRARNIRIFGKEIADQIFVCDEVSDGINEIPIEYPRGIPKNLRMVAVVSGDRRYLPDEYKGNPVFLEALRKYEIKNL